MYEYKATVTKVKDGDSLLLDIDVGFGIIFTKQSVRLARLDCAEKDTTEGVNTKDIVTKLLLNKQVIIKTIKDNKDRYGRYLVEVYLDDLNINDYLLENNYAVKY